MLSRRLLVGLLTSDRKWSRTNSCYDPRDSRSQVSLGKTPGLKVERV